jgi:hypothetical protein
MSVEDTRFFHVELQKGSTHQVAWIAERGARVGSVVELLDDEENGKGWTVISVGDKSIGREEALSLRDAWRTQREASDI